MRLHERLKDRVFEETDTVAFRVPMSKKLILKRMVQDFVDQWNRENKLRQKVKS